MRFGLGTPENLTAATIEKVKLYRKQDSFGNVLRAFFKTLNRQEIKVQR
jgi:hypothetical protein